MRLEVSTRDVSVSIEVDAGFDIPNECNLEYKGVSGDVPFNETYDVSASCHSIEGLYALIASAEPEGSDTRKEVENVLKRTEDLFAEWEAAMQGAAE